MRSPPYLFGLPRSFGILLLALSLFGLNSDSTREWGSWAVPALLLMAVCGVASFLLWGRTGQASWLWLLVGCLSASLVLAYNLFVPS